MKDYIPFDWTTVDNKGSWLEPCEESYYYAEKWRREGRHSVLDLGCGLGRHSVLFARYGFKVTAVDISDEAISFLKKNGKEQGVDISCRKADMESLPFSDDAFDCIFAMHSAGHADSEGMKKVMSEIKRVIKPGGTVFMTLCSKDTWTFAESGLPKYDENTVIKTDGPEKGVPHFYVDKEDIKGLFADFELVKVRHIDDCFGECCGGTKWKNEKHYFIEAVLHKEPVKPDYSDIIGATVECTIDRPLGKAHPRFPDMIYPVNYGYVEGIIAGDGAWQDVYVLGVDEPLERFTGRVIAVYHRLNDNEDKWIAVPDGVSLSRKEILEKIEFQEKYFDGELYLQGEKDNI